MTSPGWAIFRPNLSLPLRPALSSSMLNKTDAAYLAGLLEADGSIRIVKSQRKPPRHQSYTANVVVKMTDKDIVDWTANLWESNVYDLEKYYQGYKPQYRTKMSRAWGLNHIEEILPFMKSRKQATFLQLVLFLWMTMGKKNSSKHVSDNLWAFRDTLYQLTRTLADSK
jgi:hypothetical protein